MEKLSKCHCAGCRVNVEFDASQLAPGENRNGFCPSCGAPMEFRDNTKPKQKSKPSRNSEPTPESIPTGIRYNYVALDGRGNEQKGSVEATGQSDAIDQVKAGL